MEKQDLKYKINEFCKNKHFENPFIQACITEFIEGHTKLYGDIISAEDLFKRLDDNLNKITFSGRAKILGEYKGRIADNTDVNEIFIYFDETDLGLSEIDKKMWNLYIESDKQKLLKNMQTRTSEIKSTLIHELTHSAYVIKDKYGIGEKHIFSTSSKDIISGEYRNIGSNTNNVEAIVNYISSRIEGQKPDEIATYKAETKAIYMLTEKVDEKSIIQSAWISDEEQFKKAYIESVVTDVTTGEKSYNDFQNIMEQLVINRKKNISLSENIKKDQQLLSKLQQLLDEKDYEFKSIKDIKRIEDNIDTNIAEKENNLSFTQKIAKFLKRNNSLMNISIFKKFVTKNLNALPPAKNQDENDAFNKNTKKDDFLNKISNNGNLKKLQHLQPTNGKNINAEKNEKSGEIYEQTSEENKR